jgi:DNA-binding PadR family transcriptional regulator
MVSPQNTVGRELYERLVKDFMDIIILKELIDGNFISGYDVRVLIHKRFHILISTGIIYSLLYSMERNGLIKGMMTSKKRVYTLTEKGKEKLKHISESSYEIPLLIKSILGK